MVRARALVVLAAALLHFLSGCASLPGEERPRNRAVGARPAPSGLVVVPAARQPDVVLDEVLRTKGQAATEGAAGGVVLGAAELAAGLRSCVGAPCAAAFLILLPVFATVGAVTGGAIGAAGAEGKAVIEQGEDAIRRGIEDLSLQQRMAQAMEREAATQGVAAGAGPRAVVELEVRSLEVRPSFAPGSTLPRYEIALTTEARLVSDGTEADRLVYTRTSPSRTARQWLAGDAGAFLREMRDAVEESASTLIEELFLLYYPPAPQDFPAAASSPVPYYALRPLYPQVVASFDMRAAWIDRYRQGLGGLQYVQVDSLEPTLRWESFPRSMDVAGAGPAQRFSEVTYEIKLYRAHRTGVTFDHADLVHRAALIGAPAYRVPRLEACTRYVWTVRARFRLDGLPRVTEWSGAYAVFSNQEPWEQRRALRTSGPLRWSLPPERFYLPFRTPSGTGARCAS